MSAFQEFKLAIVSATGLSKDALHIYVGLLVFFGVVVLLRRRVGSPGPWLAALCVAAALEVMDMRDSFASMGRWDWAASLHDVVNTLFWPTAILLLARSGRIAMQGNQPLENR